MWVLDHKNGSMLLLGQKQIQNMVKCWVRLKEKAEVQGLNLSAPENYILQYYIDFPHWLLTASQVQILCF